MIKMGSAGLRNPYVIAGAVLLVIIKGITFFYTTSSLVVISRIMSYENGSLFSHSSFMVGIITVIIIEISLCIQLSCDVFILLGLCKKRHAILKVLLFPTAICYTIEVLVFIANLLYNLCTFETLFSPMHILLVVVGIIEKLFCGFVLLKIRNYYVDVRDGNIETPAAVESAGHPKLQNKWIVLL